MDDWTDALNVLFGQLTDFANQTDWGRRDYAWYVQKYQTPPLGVDLQPEIDGLKALRTNALPLLLSMREKIIEGIRRTTGLR